MSPLIRDLVVNGLLAGTAVRKAKKTSISMGIYALAGGVAALGFIFFVIAGYAYLLQMEFSPSMAASLTGSIIMLLAIGIGVSGHYSMKHKETLKKPSFDGGFVDSIESTVKSLISGFEEPVKDNPKLALLMAALAGFAAGDHLGDNKTH